MAKTKVVINDAAVAALAASDEIGQGMVRGLQPALQAAQSDAPVLTGTYRDSLNVEPYEQDGLAGAALVADVDYAVFVEAESGTLARSLDAVTDIT